MSRHWAGLKPAGQVDEEVEYTEANSCRCGSNWVKLILPCALAAQILKQLKKESSSPELVIEPGTYWLSMTLQIAGLGSPAVALRDGEAS